ncbi:MAG: hypothetical protein V3U53_00755 [bacterium]
MVEKFLTTVVGSMPKRPWLLGENRAPGIGTRGQGWELRWAYEREALRQAQDDATRLAIRDQENAGIDIISDGEQRRRYYITYVIEGLEGLDFENLAEKVVRSGNTFDVGRCVSPVNRTKPLLEEDLRFLLAETGRPVKMTLPGPVTVVDSLVDEHYGDERELGLAVADALNEEARALDALGPAVIQFDEPAFSRQPEKVADWGIEALDRACWGLQAKTATHICYGYPKPGQEHKIVDSYPVILKELEKSKIDQLSLEFEASGLDPVLLRLCPSKTVLFGCISNGTLGTAIESPEDVAGKLLAAAEHLPPEQIQAAPDCGLVKLDVETARAKLAAMVEGARLARERYGS